MPDPVYTARILEEEGAWPQTGEVQAKREGQMDKGKYKLKRDVAGLCSWPAFYIRAMHVVTVSTHTQSFKHLLYTYVD